MILTRIRTRSLLLFGVLVIALFILCPPKTAFAVDYVITNNNEATQWDITGDETVNNISTVTLVDGDTLAIKASDSPAAPVVISVAAGSNVSIKGLSENSYTNVSIDVKKGNLVALTLEDLNITAPDRIAALYSPLTEVELTIKGEVILTGGNSNLNGVQGIYTDNKLTIVGDGSLTANGGDGNAAGGNGIEARTLDNSANITGNGGTGGSSAGGDGIAASGQGGIINTGTMTGNGGITDESQGGKGIYSNGVFSSTGSITAVGAPGTADGGGSALYVRGDIDLNLDDVTLDLRGGNSSGNSVENRSGAAIWADSNLTISGTPVYLYLSPGVASNAATQSTTIRLVNSDTSYFIDNTGLGLASLLESSETFIWPAPFIQRTITDSATGVTVSGLMKSDTELIVTKQGLHTEGSCTACDEIRARHAAGELIVLYDISLSGEYTGELEVSIPVGNQYNGQTVTILHCLNSKLESVTCVVQNGTAKGTFKSLSPFGVVAHAGIPQTGDNNALALSLILALAATSTLLGVVGLRSTARNKQST